MLSKVGWLQLRVLTHGCVSVHGLMQAPNEQEAARGLIRGLAIGHDKQYS